MYSPRLFTQTFQFCLQIYLPYLGINEFHKSWIFSVVSRSPNIWWSAKYILSPISDKAESAFYVYANRLFFFTSEIPGSRILVKSESICQGWDSTVECNFMFTSQMISQYTKFCHFQSEVKSPILSTFSYHCLRHLVPGIPRLRSANRVMILV